MAENLILIGSDPEAPLYRFEGKHIKSISGVISSSLAGNELAIDKAQFSIDLSMYEDAENNPSSFADQLRALPYATPVRVFHGGALFGKFYSGDVRRTGTLLFRITASSALGVLDGLRHLGGVYTGKSLIDLLSEIIGGTKGNESGGLIPVTGGVVPFYVSSAASKAKIYGWLPIASGRNNIHQILFAHSVNIVKGPDGDMVFDFLTTEGAFDIPDDRIFAGGTVQYTAPASRVELTEHSFAALSVDESVVAFNNTTDSAPAENAMVVFQGAPLHDLTADSGITIHESGVNYAIVSGVGILTGKKYNHSTAIVALDNEDATGEEKIVSSSACTLVSPLNSIDVAERLLSYYTSARTISADIVSGNEKPGDQIAFRNPFGEEETARIASMSFRITSFVRAGCELIAGYYYENPGGDFTRVDLITKDGTWVVPNRVRRILVVAIGGGTGGSAGTAGSSAILKPVEEASGSSRTMKPDQTIPGNGGSAGTPGNGGKIYRANLEVSPGQAFPTIIGKGGAGSTSNGTAGTAGTATSFGEISSENGNAVGTGYTDLINGDTYGQNGDDGIAGGSGAGPTTTPPAIIVDGVSYTHGGRGANYLLNTSRAYASLSGGYGGGPAYKRNGNPGGQGSATEYYYAGMNNQYGTIPSQCIVTMYPAIGGTGADAQKPPKPSIPGKGGSGGNGGGGGGAFGYPATATASGADNNIAAMGGSTTGAAGGSGSAGGDGADGCVLVYY